MKRPLTLVSIWAFFTLCCSFGILVHTKNQNEQCDRQMETTTKSQNEQGKRNNEQRRQMSVLIFKDRINSIAQIKMRKQEHSKALKYKWEHSPKTRTSDKEQQKARKIIFHSFFFHSFATTGRCLTSRAIKSQKEQEQATKSHKEQQSATKNQNEPRG